MLAIKKWLPGVVVIGAMVLPSLPCLAAEEDISIQGTDAALQDAWHESGMGQPYQYAHWLAVSEAAHHLYASAGLQSNGNKLSWRAHYVDVSRDGDVGVAAGPYMTFNESGGAEESSYGHLVSVWLKHGERWVAMAELGVPIPGYLSLQVEPDYADTMQVFTEAAYPLMAADDSNDMQRLMRADALYGRTINLRGGQRALLRYGLRNIRVYLPGMAPAVGMEAASSVYGAFLDNQLSTINPIQLDVKGGYLATSREMGYTYGTMSIAVPEGGQGFRSNYLRMWRLTKSNEWKIAVEVLSPY